jgi:pyruvate formate lyase activating enzyme
MGACQHCDKESVIISRAIGFCLDCIRNNFNDIKSEISNIHKKSRRAYGLPEEPPKNTEGIPCTYCLRECHIREGDTGYCGVRSLKNRRIRGGRPHEGNLYYYYDPLPTNCVASFTCAAGTGRGHPNYAVSQGPEYGYKNLAVFYNSCSFNCLYCQNYHFKKETFSPLKVSSKELALAVDEKTSCICYFGGDPSTQILHALKASRLAREYNVSRILRICWETNGSVNEPFIRDMAKLSLESGGCIKFDLKTWDEGLHLALCGVTNRKTLDNFKKLAELSHTRLEPPLLIASTLLVPGYVDETEISGIAHFIADLNPDIPYSLLGFYPNFLFDDLPTTSRSHALRCKEAAADAGLSNVHLGNLHLLGKDY